MNNKTRMFSIFILLFFLNSTASLANTYGKNIEQLRNKGYSVNVIAPIFDQLVAFSFPKDFQSAYENTHGPQYIHEWVLKGQNVYNWTQMITETGARGLAGNPRMTPRIFASRMGAGFKNACPDSFGGYGVGQFKVDGFQAFVAVLSCGTVQRDTKRFSESALVIVIKGKRDYYTVQWAEHGPTSRGPIKFDKPKWRKRFRSLMPVKLCPIIPGEHAPYPSCVGS